MAHRSTTALAALIAALALVGCTATPPRTTDATLYQRSAGRLRSALDLPAVEQNHSACA